MAEVSVVVPIYKVEPYIHRCVDSILNQTFQDFELILVDDGSPDNCGAICDEYAAKDGRIHVIHQENGGLSAARNAGIDWVFANSDSQWLTFIDSDDWIHPEMLERLLCAATEYDVPFSVGGYESTEKENPVILEGSMEPEIWTPETFFIEKHVNAVIACAKLYHRELFRNIRYPVGKIHEDEYVTYQLLFSCEKIVFVPAPFYAYYINPAGITKGIQTIKRYDIIQAYDEQVSFFINGGYLDLLRRWMPVYLNDGYALLKWIEASPEISEYRVQKQDIEKKLYRWSRLVWDNCMVDLWEYYKVMWRFHRMKTITYGAKLIIGKCIRRLKNAFN